MRRAAVCWYFNGSVYSDITATLQNGPFGGSTSSIVTLNSGDKLYIGADEPLSGLFFLILLNPPGSQPNIIIETYDDVSESWVQMTLVDRLDNLQTGYDFVYPGYTFMTTGMAEWVISGALSEPHTATATWPETATPPTSPTNPPQLYWYRVRNAGTVALSLDRLIPAFYNTYTTAELIARYIGRKDFTEIKDPLLTHIRNLIRQKEDLLDDYMRRTYRLKLILNERDTFDPYGQKAMYPPILAVMRLGVWTGSDFQTLVQGRNQDYYVANETGMIYYTRISLGRGLPWSRAASRYLRQPESAEYDYVAGGDFDLAPKRGVIREIVNRLVCADIAMMQDWVVLLVNNPSGVPKPEKVREWRETASELMDQVRGLLVI